MNPNAESGTVSVYFITATAAFVLLTALLIDFSRIAAFRYNAELAVHSGVRSVLSSFDPIIYARYGLFVRGGEDAGEIFRTTAEGHWGNRNAGQAFPYLDAEWTGVDVTESRPLADHEVFRRQVLEEMKYKAPIDLALELADRFRGVSPALKEAASTVDVLEKMRKAYDRREAALDEVWDSQKQAGSQTVSLMRNEVQRAADFVARYDAYASGQRYQEDVSAYESEADALASSLTAATGKVRSACDEAFSTGSLALERARAANSEMRAITSQAASVPSGTDNLESDNDQEVDRGKVDSISELRKTAEQLLLDDEYFNVYATELDTGRRRGLQVGEEADRYSRLVSTRAESDGMGSALRDGAERLRSIWTEFDRAFGGGGTVLRERRALLEAHRSKDRERKAEERKAQEEWSGVTGFLGSFSGYSGRSEEREIFQKAEALARANLEWNRAEDERTAPALSGDPTEGRNRAMSEANGWMKALQGSLSGLRDELYFSEYTMQRFSYFPPYQVKRLLSGEKAPLPLENQQTEFILYGWSNPTSNIASSYGEILSIRLAIRTMEGLIECRALGHPLVVLAAALVYGIRNAMMDMNRLLQSDSVPLSKYVQVNTSYADYLRLFLLLHGGSSGHAARSIAVMELATGVSFSKAYTYVSGEGTASLRLWFFPGLLKVMGRTGQLGGTVKGNRYEVAYTADSSYQ